MNENCHIYIYMYMYIVLFDGNYLCGNFHGQTCNYRRGTIVTWHAQDVWLVITDYSDSIIWVFPTGNQEHSLICGHKSTKCLRILFTNQKFKSMTWMRKHVDQSRDALFNAFPFPITKGISISTINIITPN